MRKNRVTRSDDRKKRAKILDDTTDLFSTTFQDFFILSLRLGDFEVHVFEWKKIVYPRSQRQVNDIYYETYI